ncbi:hypothetical protein [Ruixingdingia sedimenti]|uniref:Signal transduction histidine kinase n=1 Tax=Ruixingdingia sedimenti TaxID=3073604 RepID=A0ABU1F5V2_9RHOB|nr:hypothetical protein [Xinfangfangia sp. LG-4]MDR5652252.1 hypothetical protein [Xinfangfangia sp. LG-4]
MSFPPRSSFSLFGRVAIALTLSICLSMSFVGMWLGRHLHQVELRSAVEVATGYLHLMFANSLRAEDFAGDGTPAPATVARLLADLGQMRLPGGRVIDVVLWRGDGTVLFSNDETAIGQRFDNPALGQVLAGGTAAEFVDRRSLGSASARPLLEVYVPLGRNDPGGAPLIGEVYLDASDLSQRLAGIRLVIWLAVGLGAAAMLAMILPLIHWARRVVRVQRDELDARLAHTERLLALNQALRAEADAARQDLVDGNEELLRALGADLHDGPLQLLAAAAMTLDGERRQAAGPTMTRDLLVRSIQELRDLASGLNIPELAGLGIAETVALAVERHEAVTGTRVRVTLGALPGGIGTATRICLYRIIQEGLNNAFKHAGGRDQAVCVRRKGGALRVAVINGTAAPRTGGGGQGGGLGLRGIRRRVAALGGRLRLHRPAGAARVVLLASLPPG